MRVEENIDLSNFLSFSNEVIAKEVYFVSSVAELQSVLNQVDDPIILGGGSNMLFTNSNVQRTVVKIEILGIEILVKEENYDLIAVGAGENWHNFVLWSIENNYSGLENLSLIPGTVGAAPIQNIGAYGVELKDVLHSVEAYDRESKSLKTFHVSECEMAYRESMFKTKHKGRFVITDIVLKLQKANHSYNTSYGAIEEFLEKKGEKDYSAKSISEAVIAIRSSKLPDPKQLGNAGSFFKNPIIRKSTYQDLLRSFPNMPSYNVDDHLVKIPAAWLIDQCGWRGKRVGETGCYIGQALVIVNYGKATGEEIFTHAMNVKSSVLNKFGIEIIPEVNIFQ